MPGLGRRRVHDRLAHVISLDYEDTLVVVEQVECVQRRRIVAGKEDLPGSAMQVVSGRVSGSVDHRLKQRSGHSGIQCTVDIVQRECFWGLVVRK